MIPLVNHLWQSTLFTLAAALLAWAFRRHSARLRHALWLAASLKFLIPFSLLVSAGSSLPTPVAPAPITRAAAQATEIFIPITPQPQPGLPTLPFAIWLSGCAAVLTAWHRKSQPLAAARRASTPAQIAAPIPVRFTPMLIEPGVHGLFRPVLLLPQGIETHLTHDQIDAILAHELAHVQRRDNLTAALHMAVETLFWFHPLVWWIGVKMMEARERACDEAVLGQGTSPETYAAGILNVCRFYLQSPLPCASGVSGAGLKNRIVEIVTRPAAAALTRTTKLLFASAIAIVIALPTLIGVLQAQGPAQFDVASIRPAAPSQRQIFFNITPAGGINVRNFPLRNLIEIAYGVRASQISGAPEWINNTSYDIVATVDKSAPNREFKDMPDADRKSIESQVTQRTRALLEDRFQLKIRRETHERPILALTVAKNGPKLKPAPADDKRPPNLRGGRNSFDAQRIPLALFANALSRNLSQTVVDQTGLSGNFDFKLQWDPGDEGPSIYTALQEQLGLRLESKKGPVEIIVIESVSKPTEN
jgi:uncharacterized protein (TIGR03435 family)